MSRILFVDGDAAFRASLVPPLEQRGHKVVEVRTGAEANGSLASSAPFDAIVLGGLLTDTEPVAWLEALRGRGVATPVIFATSFPQDGTSLERLTQVLGVRHVLFRPVTPAVLVTMVDALVAEAVGVAEVTSAIVSPSLEVDMPPAPMSSPLSAGAARLLVVDADAESRARFKDLAREHFVKLALAASPDEALAYARSQPIDAAFIDVELPGRFMLGEIARKPARPDTRQGDETAFRLAQELRALPGYERLPLGFVSSDGSVELRVAAAHAGGSLYLAKPLDPYTFGMAVQQLLALHRAERTRVLVVDDDEDFAATLSATLEQEGVLVSLLRDGTRVLEALEELKPDLLILDVMLPGVNGFDIARMLRTTQMWQDLPIVFLTGRTDLESRVAAFESGADDYLAKPIVYEELLAHVRMRLERRRLLREMTEKDPLTKLLSRRALLELLASRLSEARRHGRTLSLAILDVDYFKQVNDVHGHSIGDHVLAALGRLLNERFRLEDLRGRWGGEEFLIVFPGETAETAAGVLRRVLAEFQRIPFQGEQGEGFHVSFSAGVASIPDDGDDLQTLLRAADHRLYAAKDAGRGAVFGPKRSGEGGEEGSGPRKGGRPIRHGAHSR